MADVMDIPLPDEARGRIPPVMSEPYVMEWYPEDGGFPSVAIHAFDLLSGTLDGMNSEGLAVSIMADEEAIALLGPRLELHPGPARAIGVHELQVMRFLLDTCATAEEAKQALLTVKQYYAYVPNHYIVADRAGHSFVYENSTGRNVQHVIDGDGRPQVVTNFQLYQHPIRAQMPGGPPTFETNAYWRYQTLSNVLERHPGPFTPEDMKRDNACVNIKAMLEQMKPDASAAQLSTRLRPRTLWHGIYDQQALTVQLSFYLSDGPEGRGERRSEYLEFALRPTRS